MTGIVAMLLGNITIPLLAAGALGLAMGETALLIRMGADAAHLRPTRQTETLTGHGDQLAILLHTQVAPEPVRIR